MKPGDLFRRTRPHTSRSVHASQEVFTVKRVLDKDWVVCEDNLTHYAAHIVPLTRDIQDLDVQQFVDDVTAGRIQRGGVQGKFVVYTNDVGDTIIQLFKQRKD